MMNVAVRTQTTASFAQLMRLGQVAHAEGNQRQAHMFWRQAALIQPENEQVWLALLQVLEGEEDRRVCLRNILAINPHNKAAQTMLAALLPDTGAFSKANPPEQSSLFVRVFKRIAMLLLEALIMLGIVMLVLTAAQYYT